MPANSIEQARAMPLQPDLSCDDIDGIIKVVNVAIKDLDGLQKRADQCVPESDLSDIEYELLCLEDRLEAVRKSNEGLREWGQGWKDACLALEDISEV